MDKKLLVYFSYSGNTRMIAKKIKESINCDVLELKPKVAYSNDYELLVDEFKNNEQTRKTTKLQDYSVNIDDYDCIIIGSPVWWYTITPVIRTFLKDNDLSNKKIIPFATNAGWLGSTFDEIKELCPNSEVLDEMNIVFDGNKIKDAASVNLWIERMK